jgi:hypothetical protein
MSSKAAKTKTVGSYGTDGRGVSSNAGKGLGTTEGKLNQLAKLDTSRSARRGAATAING